MLSRRSLLALAAASPFLNAAPKRYPVGLEMYSVRTELEKDLEGTIRKVAGIGFEDVEFYGPYYSWSPAKAKEVRKLLDDLNVTCLSTHNLSVSFKPEGIQKAIDLNSILGSRFVVLATPGNIHDLDGWKRTAEMLSKAADRFASANLRAGCHNDSMEFKSIEGQRPMDILAANTPKSVMLQLDIGHCVASGGDPVSFINEYPGRIRSLHLKDWSPRLQWETLLGEGVVQWNKVFQAAEKTGGVEFYLIEHEGHESAPFPAARECLANYKRIHG
jgi:sugar phosphate isomerase/epimerase